MRDVFALCRVVLFIQHLNKHELPTLFLRTYISTPMSSSKFKPTRARPRDHSPSEDEHRDATRWNIDDRARANLDLEGGLGRDAASSWRRRMASESLRGCDRGVGKRGSEREGGPGGSLAKQSETPPPPYLHSSSHSSQHPLVLHRHAYPQLWSASTTAVFVPVQLPVIPVAVVAADYSYPASNSTHDSTRNPRSSINYGSHDLSSVSLTRARIKALEAQVPHIPQPSQWDCGLACVSMVLKSLRLFSHSDPLDLRMFVHRDAVQLGSVWTIDLAYLLKAFGVTDFTYYTTYIGVNYNYASKQFYKNAFQTDSRRIHSLFADAQDNGVRVVPLLLPLDDMKRFLMSGRYAVLMLVNLSSVQCRVCRRKAIRAEKKRRKEVWSQRWRTVGLSWLCGNPVPPSEPMDMSGCFDDGLLDHARHQDGYLFCDVNMHAVVSESRRKRQKGKKRLQGQSSTVAFSRNDHMTNFQDANYHPTVQIPSTDRTPLLQKQQSPTVLSDYQSVRSAATLEVIPTASRDEAPAPVKKPAAQEPNTSCSPIAPPEQREPAERDSWHIPPGITIAAVENLESEFSVVKTVSSAVTWLGTIVFGGPATESTSSLETSPSATDSNPTTSSAPSPSTASPVSTSKKRHPPPPGVQISAYSQDNDDELAEEEQSPDLSPSRRRAKPPGVGVVSKVDDESMNRLYILNQGMRRASGAADNPLSSGRMDSGVGGFGGSKSQPASKSGSPLRPSVLANHAPGSQKHQQSSQRSASPVSPYNLNDRPKVFSNVTSTRNIDVTASTAKTSPTLLSFLTPSMRSPQKHRAFSIPGTDSEMALAAAAAASSVSSNAAATKAAMESHGMRHPKTVVPPLSRRDGSPGPSPSNPLTTSLADSSRATIEKRSVWFRDSVMPADGRDVSGEVSGGSKREEIFARRGVVFSENERGDGTLAREAATAAEHTSRRGSVSFWGGVLGTATAQSSPQGAVNRDEDEDDEDDDGFESAEGEFGGVDDEDVDDAFEDVDDAQMSDDWCSDDSSSDSDESLKTATCWSGFTACMPRSSVRRSSSQMHLSQNMTSSVDGNSASPLRRGNSSSSLSSGGGFSRFFQRSGATPSNTEQEEFVGHYILFIGYDAKTDGFIYRDPGIEERLCVMSGSAVEFARSGIPGSDHDVIVVRAGV
ncbi:hypothetical protein HDU78_004638 [Chytriomyces hyalinus]|nr:hypothetical protein HDU78_004638 [Chytriomyces hyalinus]